MAKHTIECEYWIGDTVYMKHDIQNEVGQVLKVKVTPIGITYSVSIQGGYDRTCYEIELTREPNYPVAQDEDDDEST